MSNPISEILTKALAGYDDTYKMESNEKKYIQWAAVERDLIAVLSAETQRRQAAEAVVDKVLNEHIGLVELMEDSKSYRVLYPKEKAT